MVDSETAPPRLPRVDAAPGLTRRDLVDRHGTRSTRLGGIAVTMLRLPAGVTVVHGTPPSEPRSLQLVLPVESALIVRERGGEQHLVGRRELSWLAGWSPVAFYAADDLEVAWLELPSRVLDAHAELSAPLPSRPAHPSALVEPMRAFVQTALAVEHGDAVSPGLFDDLVGAMLAALVHEARAAQAAQIAGPERVRTAGSGLRAQAVAHIAAFRADPRLSPQQIARGLRISVRQLQRAFEEAGTTVATEIRRQRLEAAVEMLTSERFDGCTVAEVAARAGFRNDAELRRALAAWTGTTPSELRGRRLVAVT